MMKTKWLMTAILSSSLLLPIHQVSAQSEGEDVRFRVLAHSDEEQDQSIKQTIYSLVQHQIIQTLGEQSWNKEDLMNEMDKHLDDWQQLVNNTLVEEGYDYKATVRFEKHLFPEKQTDERVYVEGIFDTVLVTLGDGLGENWWCSIFPDLCGQVLIKEAKAEEKEDKSTCQTDLSPEKDLSSENIQVESYVFKWFTKGWDWITN